MDSVLGAATFNLIKQSKNPNNFIFIVHDREEAFFVQNDLQNLLYPMDIYLFPASYKRPYQFEEVENANILQRAEVLSAVNQVHHKNGKNFLIVTYPEALVEKVINKKSLLDNTLIAKVGEQLDMDFIAEVLISYDFEKTDFVYEPGQFAVRGGIFDIYSFSSDLPYRLEFFDDEIESIRTF